jgi:hypothetical protein
MARQGRPVLAGQSGQLAQKGVDWLEGGAGVEADGEHFV